MSERWFVMGLDCQVDVNGSWQKMKDSDSLIYDYGGDHSSFVTRGQLLRNYGLTDLRRK